MTDRNVQEESVGAEASLTKLAASRHRRILDLLSKRLEIQVSALSERLQVSNETVRRDLRVLEQAGKLKRVHGGAVLLRGKEELPYLTRIETLRGEKERIADACHAELALEAGQLVFVGGGSTMLHLAHKLAHSAPARFVTNTIDVAYALAGSGVHEVSLTGGRMHGDHELLVGYDTLSAVTGRVFDLVVTSTNAIDAEIGFLEYEEAEARLHQALERHSRRYVILADHTKFGRTASYAALPIGAIDLIVTDARPAERFVRAFRKARVAIRWPPDRQ